MTRGSLPIRRIRSAFTLIELLVAMSASTILIGAMGSLIVITTSAIPAGDDRGSLSADASYTLQRIADDLSFATSITLGDGVLALEVPDQTGDSQPESICYWLDSENRLRRGAAKADPDAATVLSGVTGFVTERDSGTGVIRAVRIELTVNNLGLIETSVETVARPAE